MAGAGGSSVETAVDAPADSQFAPTTKSTDGATAIAVSDSEFTTPTTCTQSSTDTTPTGSSDFTDDFATNSGWTQTGTLVTVDSGVADKLAFAGASQNADRRVSKSLGITLNNTQWVADFTVYVNGTSNNGSSCIPIGFFASATDPLNANNVDALFFAISHNSTPNPRFYIGYKDGAGSKTFSASSYDAAYSTQYYCRLARTSATNLRLYVYTGSLGGTLVATIDCTIPSTVQSLTHVQATIRGDDGTLGAFTLEVDDLVVYDNEVLPDLGASNMKDNKSSPTTLRAKTTSAIGSWVKADMGSAVEMLGVAVHFHADTDMTSFKIETSADDSTYIRRKTVPYTLITEGAWNIILFPRPPLACRYLKITALDAGAKVISINEIAVFVLTESVINRRHRIVEYTPTSSCLTLTGA